MGLFDFFRKKSSRQPAADDETITRHSFVLCKGAEPTDLSRADAVVNKVFGEGYSTELSDGNIVTVLHGEDTVGFLAHMPAPIPGEEAEHAADGNILWPNGKEEAARHQSHVLITNIGGGNPTPVQSALTVTRLTRVALDLFDGIGVYWGNAHVSHQRGIFEDFCQDASDEHLPVMVWLRLQLVREHGEQLGIYTVGMSQFDLMEIEIDRCALDAEALIEFVSNLAHYIIQSGPVIADGNTVGGSADERILVHHRPSMIDKKRKVYKVVFD